MTSAKFWDVLTRGGSGYAAKQIWLMAHYQTLAMAQPANLAKHFIHQYVLDYAQKHD